MPRIPLHFRRWNSPLPKFFYPRSFSCTLLKRRTADLLSCPVLTNGELCGGDFDLLVSEAEGDEVMFGSLSCRRDESHNFQVRDFGLASGVSYSSDCGVSTKTKGIPYLEPVQNTGEYTNRGSVQSNNVYARFANPSLIRMSHKCEYGPFLDHPSDSCEAVYSTAAEMARKGSERELLLDLGCGLGRTLVDLQDDFNYLIGLDSSPSMIASAKQIVQSQSLNISFESMAYAEMHRETFRSFGYFARTDFVVGNAYRIPFRKGTFDCIAAIFLIDRLSQPRLVLDEISRVLKPEGTLVLVDPYDWDPDITSQDLWMEKADIHRELESRGCDVEESADNIPYNAVIHPRKVITFKAHAIRATKRDPTTRSYEPNFT